MGLLDIFKSKKKAPSAESIRAHRSAEESLEQARRDMHRVNIGSMESKLVAHRIREHNAANHYDDWLSEQFLKYYK